MECSVVEYNLSVIYQPAVKPKIMQKIGTPIPAQAQIMSAIKYKEIIIFVINLINFFI